VGEPEILLQRGGDIETNDYAVGCFLMHIGDLEAVESRHAGTVHVGGGQK
jgi:hypothetical protein